MSGGTVQRRVFVTGRVQGVGFRASTYHEASRHSGLRGFVRNLPDGRVEAVFQGNPEAVSALADWCRTGPRSAQVTSIEVRDEDPDTTLPPFGISELRS